MRKTSVGRRTESFTPCEGPLVVQSQCRPDGELRLHRMIDRIVQIRLQSDGAELRIGGYEIFGEAVVSEHGALNVRRDGWQTSVAGKRSVVVQCIERIGDRLVIAIGEPALDRLAGTGWRC